MAMPPPSSNSATIAAVAAQFCHGKTEVDEANKRRKKAAKQNNRNLCIQLQDKLRAVQEWAGTKEQTDEL